MRPARLAIGALLTLPSLSGFALAGYLEWAASRPEPETIQQPMLSWEQKPDRILLHIHNVNRTRGLRNQPVHVRVYGEKLHLVSYHPGQIHHWPDGREFECCHITLLPPGGDYTITLLPQRHKVAGFTVNIRDKDPWKRMR